MEFGKQLAKYRKDNKIDQKDIAKLLEVTTQTVSAYETGTNKIPYEKLITLCNHYKINPLDLISADLTFNLEDVDQQEQQLIDAYNNLPDSDKRVVDFILGIGECDIKSESIETEHKIIYRFPVYEQQAAAGAGITGRDGKFTMENIFTDDIPQNAVFGVHIKGTSMVNTDPKLIIEDIPDNSFVLLNPKVSVADLNKTIVVASINNEVICKYFLIEQDGVHFYSLNREEHADDDRFAKSPNEYRIIGHVVKVIKPEEHE